MSSKALIEKLQQFKGKRLIDCADAIISTATEMKFSVNVIDPEFNMGSIDEDPARLNVRTDANSIITSFTIG